MASDNQQFQAIEKPDGSCTFSSEPAVQPQLTLGQAIRGHAALQTDHTAILSTYFAPLSYRDLQRQLVEIRMQLRQGGFPHSARIGVLLPNGPEAVLALVAVACAAVAVPLDPRQTPAEFDQLCDALGLDALLVLQDSSHEVRRVAEQRNLTLIEVIPIDNGRLGLTLKIQLSASPAPDSEPAPHEPAFILQTSGTSAHPKLIPFSHANMLAAAARLKAWFRLTPQDRCLCVSPPFYSHGLKVTVLTPLLTGGSIAVPSDPAKVDLHEWFEALRPTWYSAGPALHRAVLDKAQTAADAASLHTLRFVVSGGAPLPGAIREELQSILAVPVLEHYGSSEAAQIAANLPTPGLSRPGTCGRPWPGTVTIVDEDGSSLPPGQQGEVWVRGPTVISGYLEDPELNHRAFVDGWLRTGDLGSLDADGFLSLHGRLNEVINRGGEKIAPAEVDGALLRHSAVAEAAAFAVPHPRLGEDVAAAVVLHPGASATAPEIRRFLLAELTSFKVPHRILIVDQLPKGKTGKVQRRQLTEGFSGSVGEPLAMQAPVMIEHAGQLERELLKLWRRLLGSQSLTMDDSFFDSGGDSLLASEMLLEVERMVGYPVPGMTMFDADTIRQLVPRIIAQRGAPAEIYAHIPADGGDRPPLFLFHGDFIGGGFEFRHMVSLLGPDQPIVTIDPHGLRGEAIPPSFEAMAADRLPLILERQASGPFLLGGKCNGGLVAFEVARLLRAAGHEIGMVVMIDPPTVCARPAMQTILRNLKDRVSPRQLAWTHEQMARLERIFYMSPLQVLARLYRGLRDGGFGSPPSPRRDAYADAMARYLPAPLDVPVVFYAATHHGRAWTSISPDFEVIEVPGGHDACMTEGAGQIAAHLQQRIARVCEK